MPSVQIPKHQTVALVREPGGPVEFVDDYPVKSPGQDEVLAKVYKVISFVAGLMTKEAQGTKPAA